MKSTRWRMSLLRRSTMQYAAAESGSGVFDDVERMFDGGRYQKAKEEALNKRRVVFCSSRSGDHRARIAAQEAFDSAATALGRTPNICLMNVTLDNSTMLDAPEVVWAQLCKANNLTSELASSARHVCMLGGAVNHQRLGGNAFVEVLLGCIPDLLTDVFTFDAIPTKDELSGAAQEQRPPPPFAVVTHIDAKLMLQHELALQERIHGLRTNLPDGCVVGGAVYPPVGNVGARDKKATIDTSELDESVFFLNDRVYRGSAAGIVLRSAMVRGHERSIVPSIVIQSGITVSGVTEVAPRCLKIASLGGRPATDVIRDTYADKTIGPTSKLFVGLSRADGSTIPVTFFAKPETGTDLFLVLPLAHDQLVDGDRISLVVDDVELDTEAGATELMSLEKPLIDRGLVSLDHLVTVAREGKKTVSASSSAGIHFSHRHMNVRAERDGVISLGIGSTHGALTAPSVMQRVLGRMIAGTGVYVPGQVVTVGGTSSVAARSSSYMVFEGLE